MTKEMKVHVLETGTMEADLTWLLLKPGRVIKTVQDRQVARRSEETRLNSSHWE